MQGRDVDRLPVVRSLTWDGTHNPHVPRLGIKQAASLPSWNNARPTGPHRLGLDAFPEDRIEVTTRGSGERPQSGLPAIFPGTFWMNRAATPTPT